MVRFVTNLLFRSISYYIVTWVTERVICTVLCTIFMINRYVNLKNELDPNVYRLQNNKIMKNGKWYPNVVSPIKWSI